MCGVSDVYTSRVIHQEAHDFQMSVARGEMNGSLIVGTSRVEEVVAS